MTQPGRALALLLGLMLLLTAPSAAQRRAVLEVAPPGAGGIGATVTATNLFAEPDMRDLVRSGFPASLHFRLELWRSGGLFDDLEGRLDWNVIVQYDPSAQRYRVVRQQAGKVEDLGSFATLATAQSTLERPTRTTLLPDREGVKYYYTLALDIEALSVSDMDQLERWLRGVKGNTAASAVGTGLRTLMLRMLGGEKRHFTGRSVVFVGEK
ncbi:MAG: hypothetical protein JWL61_2568 [Gemmatimonadetes bacterium]|jgi:hypothetical protein|nr:hypothetical protein [Gemmatimonadota bacterium]